MVTGQLALFLCARTITQSECVLCCMLSAQPAHEILVFIAYLQKPPINAYVNVSSGAKGLNVDPSPHQHSYVVYSSSKASVETARLRRLV